MCMCGRYHIESEEQLGEMQAIIDEISRKYSEHTQVKTGEIYPTDVVPVIAKDGPQPMAWGFPWEDKYGKKHNTINARSETVADKWMFAKPLQERRVVIPTNGFYEWAHEGKKATDKYLFTLPDEPILYLAGIWSQYQSPDSIGSHFTILTTEANKGMAPFHDRMPVHISRNERDAWINDSRFVKEALMRPQPQLVPTLVNAMLKVAQNEQMSLF